MPIQTMNTPHAPLRQDHRLRGSGPHRSRRGFRWLPLLAALVAAPLTAVGAEDELIRGPDVTIIAQEDKTVFEFRQGGELRMIRVVPRWGKPYYLVPDDRAKNFGDLERAERLLPSWVIIEF